MAGGGRALKGACMAGGMCSRERGVHGRGMCGGNVHGGGHA